MFAVDNVNRQGWHNEASRSQLNFREMEPDGIIADGEVKIEYMNSGYYTESEFDVRNKDQAGLTASCTCKLCKYAVKYLHERKCIPTWN